MYSSLISLIPVSIFHLSVFVLFCFLFFVFFVFWGFFVCFVLLFFSLKTENTRIMLTLSPLVASQVVVSEKFWHYDDFPSATTGDVRIIPSFQIWGYELHVEHISCVFTNCGQHQIVIPSLFLNSSLDFTGGKHDQKTTLPKFRHVLPTFALRGCFPYILFFKAIFSPYFLLVGSLLQYVALFQSGELVKH